MFNFLWVPPVSTTTKKSPSVFAVEELKLFKFSDTVLELPEPVTLIGEVPEIEVIFVDPPDGWIPPSESTEKPVPFGSVIINSRPAVLPTFSGPELCAVVMFPSTSIKK